MSRVLAIGCLLAACGDNGDGAPDAFVDPGLGEDIAAIPNACFGERSEIDRPDDGAYDQIRVLYVTSSDGPDMGHDTDGQICNSIRGMATWFHAQTNSYLRFDTSDHKLDIGFARLSRTDVEMRGNDPGNLSINNGIAFVRERIELEIDEAPNKLYAVFYEGTSSYSCGGGAYPPLVAGRLGAMYLRATPPGQNIPCGDSYPWGQPNLIPSYVDYAILHELVHSLGLVPPASPNQHSSGHVYDTSNATPQRDLMYSQRPGMPDAPWGVLDPAGLVLDLGNDDYYNAQIGLDLSTSSLIAPLSADAHRPPGW